MKEFDPGHAVVARGLTKFYGETRAVEDLSFCVPFGSVTGFLGPNGAGKTTTVRMILGLVRPDRGSVTVLGKPYRDHACPAKLVGALLDASGGHPWRRGRDHLRILATLSGLEPRRVEEVLDLVDLRNEASRRVGTFSLGMRQRLGIAAALLGDPQLLILDEPANGLDPAGVRWLRGFLRSLADEGRAVFVSSHVLTEVTRVADRVLIITRGSLVAESDLDQLTDQAGPAVRVRTSEAERLRTLLDRDGIEVEGLGGGQLRVLGTSTADIGRLAAQHGIALQESTTEPASLEDVFLGLTERFAHEAENGTVVARKNGFAGELGRQRFAGELGQQRFAGELTQGFVGELTSGQMTEPTDRVGVETRDDVERDPAPRAARAAVESRLPSPTGKDLRRRLRPRLRPRLRRRLRRTPLSQLAAAEVHRIRTNPVIWLLVAGALALVGVSIASGITTAYNADTPLGSEAGQSLLFASAQAGWIFTLVLGILGVAGEYRHRTASVTFLVEPRRWRIFAAKVMAHWFVGLLFGLLCGAVAVAISKIWAAVSGVTLRLDIAAWRVLGGALVTVVLYGLLGLGVGALLRSQMAALAAVLGWSLVVEPLLAGLWPGLGKYFPNGAASALTTAAGSDVLSRGTGTLLFAGYVTAFLLLGLHAISRRDVTT